MNPLHVVITCLLIFYVSKDVSPVKNVVGEGCEKIRDNPATTEEQLENCIKAVEGIKTDLDKYIYLRNIQNNNEDLFYACLLKNINLLLPVVYTPVVGLACQNYGLIPGQQRGLFITVKNKGHVEEILRKWPHKEVKAVVVTDGERILGLGDLGANGMGISIGKMALYTALGGVHHEHCLPVTIDVGTNNKDLLKDGSPYVGLRQKRVTGAEYYQLIDEFMEAVVKVFGKNTLIQFEDFANHNAFMLLAKYRHNYTMFNDDIQGTAAVTVAGMLAAERFTKKKLADCTILLVGAGEAGVGIANLLVTAIGGDPQQARSKIFMKRSTGLLQKGDEFTYPETDDRRLYCHRIPAGAHFKDLFYIVKWMKPDILIGVSGAGKLFDADVLKALAEVKETPIIMALSNPNSKAECTAEEAYTYTKGKCLFTSGSPFPPVMVNGSLKSPQQCNNAYVFPGIALAITAAKMTSVPEKVFLIAAQTLANKCTQPEDFDRGSLYPTLDRLRDCSVDIAAEIVKYAFKNNLSGLQSQPSNIKEFILSHHYDPYNHLHNKKCGTGKVRK